LGTAHTRHWEAYGYRVLRFSNARIERDIDSVLDEIAAACASSER
jgi:very-short-patch-repair endonuclease